jgi:cobalt-zinc-cadmium efflux system outer membrane protein
MKTLLSGAVLLMAFWHLGWGLTLDQAIETALIENPRLKSAHKAWEASQSERTRVSALPDPVVEMGYGSSGRSFDGTMEMIGISQMIPFPTKIIGQRSKATLAGMAAEVAYLAGEKEVVKEVKDTYVDLYLLRQTIAIYEQDLADALLVEEVARLRYEVGRATQHDLIKAQLEAHLMRNQIQVLRQDDLVSVSYRLKTLLNLDRKENMDELSKPAIPIHEIDINQIRSVGTVMSPQVKFRTYLAEVARQDLSLAKMTWIPDLKFRVFREEMDMVMGRNKVRGVMFSFNVPLWAWGNQSDVEKRGYILEQAVYQLEAAQDAANLGLEQALASFYSGRESLDLYAGTLIPEAELAYASARSAYETGEVDILTLISAQRTLRDARLSHLRLWAELAKDLAEIERITGRRFY